jgi:Ca2+-binding EF-hand superfamily protein
MKQLMGNVEDEEVQQIMQRLDLNNDNKISKEEFIQHVISKQGWLVHCFTSLNPFYYYLEK